MDDQQDGITAYHGSPHDFDEFDTSKIGTGEGAQAYGHGLYFAQAEPVAKGYRDALSQMPGGRASGKIGYKIDGNVVGENDLTPSQQSAINEIRMYDNDAERAFNINKRHGEVFGRPNEEVLNEINKLKGKKIEDYHPGHMYEVHINAHPHHMLDWDKSLNNQTGHVRKVLNNIDETSQDLIRRNAYKFSNVQFGDLSGEDFYKAMIDGSKGKTAKDISNNLRDAGIKGIKYLDAGSRGDKAEPTHNYVVFDHNDVHIKRKYEQGGAVEGFADGGDVWDDSRVRRSGEGGTETALDFIQNAPLYKQRMEAHAPQPAPVAAPSTEGKSMPVTAAPPPAIVQPAQPVQQKQEQPQGQVGLYAVGTNDPNPDMTVQSAQRIIESSRAMGINPVFLLPNQAGGTQYAKNSKALQDYLDSVGIQYQMPQYGDKDPLHMTPSWASGASKSYNAPFLAGDSNSVRLGIVGYGAKGDGKTIVHPESGAVLGRVGANSKAVADELERHLKWQMQNRTQRNTGGPVNVSKGQDTAGNFKKEHEKIHGIPVAVEVKEGHDRVKYEPDGSLKFKAKQYADYGAILGTKDADGMNTDVMVGPHKDSDKAYIIDQRKHSTGKFDEHKVMLGFNKRKKAIKAYTKSYTDRHGKDRVQDVVKTDIAGLKKWLKHGNLKVAAAKDALINRALEVVSKKT